jgi:4'-phosphopantetheinyl transferase EntD
MSAHRDRNDGVRREGPAPTSLVRGRRLLPDVLPPGTEGAECVGDLVPDRARPEELAAVSAATPARVAEFRTVRVLARRAMARLALEVGHGAADHPLLPDARGAPAWPPGLVGSMTHTGEYRAALVAPAGTYAGIGLDAELSRELPAQVRELVCRPEERRMIEVLERRDPTTPWGCVVFSAKESVYKAWNPLTGLWLDYEDIAVRLDAEQRTFRARLTGSRSPARSRLMAGLRGAWSADDALTVTTAVLPATDRGRGRRR